MSKENKTEYKFDVDDDDNEVDIVNIYMLEGELNKEQKTK